MKHVNEVVSKTSLLAAVLMIFAVLLTVVKTTGQEAQSAAAEQWEYLVVAGPSTTNFTATGNPRMRKEPNVGFGREAFVLEQHMDKLGTSGLVLVTVAGPPTDPVFYFKRRK